VFSKATALKLLNEYIELGFQPDQALAVVVVLSLLFFERFYTLVKYSPGRHKAANTTNYYRRYVEIHFLAVF
jgi:hypothetical protein